MIVIEENIFCADKVFMCFAFKKVNHYVDKSMQLINKFLLCQWVAK